MRAAPPIAWKVGTMNDRERTIAGLRRILADHADDPNTGACRHCRLHYCPMYAEAQAELTLLGIDLVAERAA